MKQAAIKREAGFTLVELMMVIFVVGIMAGLVVMTIGGNSARELKKDTSRIQQLLVMAQDEAVFSGQEIGFFIDRDQQFYGFLSFDNQKLTWEPMEKEAFAQRELPEGARLDLDIDGAPVDLKKIHKEAMGKKESLDNWLTVSDSKEVKGNKDKRNKVTPSLLFFSDGHYTPFRLQVSSQLAKDSMYVIDGDGLGAVRMSEAKTSGKKTTKKRKQVHE